MMMTMGLTLGMEGQSEKTDKIGLKMEMMKEGNGITSKMLNIVLGKLQVIANNSLNPCPFIDQICYNRRECTIIQSTLSRLIFTMF